MKEPLSREAQELQQEYRDAAGAWGAGMAKWERGEMLRSEVGTLKRRMDRAETAFRAASYGGL